jgi:hypothetical protein
MDAATKKSIQWIATDIDDLSLYLRVYRLDQVVGMLDEARHALQAPSMHREESVAHIGSHAPMR